MDADEPTDVHQADVPQTVRTVWLRMTHQPGVCRGCVAEIEWHEIVGGRPMPVNMGAKPVQTRGRDENAVGEFLASDTHWATCPQAKHFHGGRR
jgi:hypothetical protein